MWLANVRVVAIWSLPFVVAAIGLASCFLKTARRSGESTKPPVQALSEETAKQEALDQFQRDWLCIAAERNGKKVPTDKVNVSELVFSMFGEAVTLDRVTANDKVTAKQDWSKCRSQRVGPG